MVGRPSDGQCPRETPRMMQPDRRAIILIFTAGLTACGGGSSSDSAPAPAPPPSAPPPSAPANRPPVISGTPAGTVRVGEAYEFSPVASDPDGNTLSFSIQNRPAWMNFETTSGRLTGTPAATNLGRHEGIVIAVSDGVDTTALGTFAVEVIPPLGSVTLRWAVPTTNKDGTSLDNLAAYIIYYGQSPAYLDRFVTVDDPSLTRHMISGLTETTWYFAMTSYTAVGVEGERSGTVPHVVKFD